MTDMCWTGWCESENCSMLGSALVCVWVCPFHIISEEVVVTATATVFWFGKHASLGSPKVVLQNFRNCYVSTCHVSISNLWRNLFSANFYYQKGENTLKTVQTDGLYENDVYFAELWIEVTKTQEKCWQPKQEQQTTDRRILGPFIVAH